VDATQRSQGTAPAEGSAHGYIKAKDKVLLQNRLRRIEGQVRGVQRMVDEEAYCVDVLTQIASVVAAWRRWVPYSSRTTSNTASGSQ
jgi:hypothetical protein